MLLKCYNYELKKYIKSLYSRVCGNRKTEILNKVGHVIQVLVTITK